MSERLQLRENEAHDLPDGVRMVASNFYERDYRRADGSPAHGLSAMVLFSSGDKAFVGEGATLDLAGRTWTVAAVEPRGADGWARLTLEARD